MSFQLANNGTPSSNPARLMLALTKTITTTSVSVVLLLFLLQRHLLSITAESTLRSILLALECMLEEYI